MRRDPNVHKCGRCPRFIFKWHELCIVCTFRRHKAIGKLGIKERLKIT